LNINFEKYIELNILLQIFSNNYIFPIGI
jgi:hypothetical protein